MCARVHGAGGAVDNISAWMDSMPRTMREELGVGLGFLHNYKTGRRGMLCKVPFFFELESADVLRIGCRLCAQKYGIQSGESAIMREGERGDEMYVITEGSVRIERYSDEGLADKGLARRASETFDAEVGTGSPRSARATAAAAAAAAAAISTGHEHRRERKNLGLLREFDFFGELCVLARDEDGLHLRRGRSATAASSVCMVHSLSYGALQDLRRQSPTIDAAIRHAVARVRRARPSLFRADSRSSPGGSSPRGGDGGGAEGGRGEGAPLSLQEQFEELARWQRQVASETADRMATLRAAFARSDATRTAERLV
jgi:CRP-like cAMP-binding protein